MGTYDLLVGGADVADIVVENQGQGKVRFDSRFARGGIQLLAFDPLCQSLAVSQTVDSVTTAFLTIDQFGASQGACGGP